MNQPLHLHNRHTGEDLHITRRVENGREVLFLEGSLPPHSEGPPMHTHLDQDESGEVVSGQLSAILDGKPITRRAGERVFIPRGVRHRWWNSGDEVLVFNGKAEPAGDFDQYLEGIFAILNASASGRPSLFHIAHFSLRYPSQRLSPAPAWVDRILFRIIVAIGTLAGAYPASGWPGAPKTDRGDGNPRTTLA